MPVRSFKGNIPNNGQDTISLHTNTGSVGYRIKKFQIMHTEPGQLEAEHTIKIYKVKQTSVTNNINFADNTLLAAAYLKDHDGNNNPLSTLVIFDNEIFNQDIFVTHVDTNETYACNYYIELEMIKLDLNENTVATLKDIRNETLSL